MAATAAPPTGTLRLQAPARVALHVDELGSYPATVVATTPEAATLVLGPGALPARTYHRRRVTLERLVGDRSFFGEGTLLLAADHQGRAREDALVLRFGAPQRRAQERVAAVVPVTLVPVTAQLGPARALTLDVSRDGALVRSPAPLEPGHEVQLHLQLPTEELPVPAAGAVVRSAGDGLLGVRLDRMRDADRELVERFLREQARRIGPR